MNYMAFSGHTYESLLSTKLMLKINIYDKFPCYGLSNKLVKYKMLTRFASFLYNNVRAALATCIFLINES